MSINTKTLLLASTFLVHQAFAQTTTASAPSFELEDISEECAVALSEAINNSDFYETPADEEARELVQSYENGEFYNTEDPCQLPEVTDSALASEFSEYAATYTDWLSKHATYYKDIFEACPTDSGMPGIITVSHLCSDLAAMITGNAGNDADQTTPTTTGTDGPKETGKDEEAGDDEKEDTKDEKDDENKDDKEDEGDNGSEASGRSTHSIMAIGAIAAVYLACL